MKLKTKPLFSAILLAILLCFSAVLCSCYYVTPQWMYDLDDEICTNVWECDDFVIKEHGIIEVSIDGNSCRYQIFGDLPDSPTTLNTRTCDLDKMAVDKNTFISEGNDQVKRPFYVRRESYYGWKLSLKIKDDHLYLTVIEDFPYLRGETKTDYTGREFVLTKMPKNEETADVSVEVDQRR